MVCKHIADAFSERPALGEKGAKAKAGGLQRSFGCVFSGGAAPLCAARYFFSTCSRSLRVLDAAARGLRLLSSVLLTAFCSWHTQNKEQALAQRLLTTPPLLLTHALRQACASSGAGVGEPAPRRPVQAGVDGAQRGGRARNRARQLGLAAGREWGAGARARAHQGQLENQLCARHRPGKLGLAAGREWAVCGGSDLPCRMTL